MKIIFCLPGASFSARFLQCWTELLGELPKVGISFGLSQQYLCNIYHVRTKCLGASLDRGTDQKPFGGKIDYDYIMWIDSDIIFKPEQFFKLIDHDRDIVSGLYMMQDNINYATVEHMDEDFLQTMLTIVFYKEKTSKRKKVSCFELIILEWVGCLSKEVFLRVSPTLGFTPERRNTRMVGKSLSGMMLNSVIVQEITTMIYGLTPI